MPTPQKTRQEIAELFSGQSGYLVSRFQEVLEQHFRDGDNVTDSA